MYSKTMKKSKNKVNPDMAKIMAAFETSMDFDDDGYYVHDLEAVDRFEEFYVHRDETFNVVDCNFNTALSGFCAALRTLKQGESVRIDRSNSREQISFERFVA